ncbi:MAG: transposase [Planctomycetaceae bacterium]|nr:transposase [Planctomycetaceae bacterium]
MKINKQQEAAVTRFETFAQRIAKVLPRKTQPFIIALIFGVLLAVARRRTVTQWLKAAQISDDFRQAFYHIPHVGRKGTEIFDEHLKLLLEQLGPTIMASSKIRIVLDDSPTKRYGKKIEGAGYHHNPTPGRTNAKTCFGHSWVVAVLVVTHPLFGEISFPMDAVLYLRQKEIDKLDEKYGRQFKPKTTIVVEMVKRLVPKFKAFEKKIEILVDGGYAKDTVLLPLGDLKNVTTITRLRRDAALFEIPPQPEKKGRGRPKTYGNRIDVKSMVEEESGWRYVECRQYGQVVKKRVKWFTATSKLTRGKPIKVVVVKEDEKTWVPLVSTDANQEVKEILESYGVRFGIEEVFKDLKETWGWGKQELRLLESNEAATVMNLVLYGLTELATWNCAQEELVDRKACPWDDANRRPSHADRRNYLRHGILANEFNVALHSQTTTTKLKIALKRLLSLAG